MDKINTPRMDGILKNGYGTVPKYVMHDQKLSLESKAIYAYLCALAGRNKKTFPYRDTILRHLGLSKNTYYRHYKPLLENGYITVSRTADKSAANIYTLSSGISGRDSKGYGIIPKSVMMNENLSVKAKGLYAYLCSYCGTSRRAFPRKDNIIFHLGISESTYYKYYNQLLELGYLTSIQRREGSLFGVNDYHLDSRLASGLKPPSDPEKSAKQKRDPEKHANNADHLGISSNPNIWDMKNGDTVFRDTKNCDIYLNNKNPNNNLSIINPSNIGKTTDGSSGFDFIKSTLDKLKTECPNNFRWVDKLPSGQVEELIPAFMHHFDSRMSDKPVRNVSAYMKTSLRNWLADYNLSRELGWRGKSPPEQACMNASYSMEDIERVIDA